MKIGQFCNSSRFVCFAELVCPVFLHFLGTAAHAFTARLTPCNGGFSAKSPVSRLLPLLSARFNALFARLALLPFARRGGIVSSRPLVPLSRRCCCSFRSDSRRPVHVQLIHTIPRKCRNHAVFRGIVRFRHPPTGHKLPAPIRETRA